jgi:cell division protein FtsX
MLSFAAGYLVGHMTVLRKRGLLAGALVGAIVSLGGFIVHSLPTYPDKIVSVTPSSSGAIITGILAAMLFLLIYSAIGALIALWGAWTATRKHPYYQLTE